MDDQEDTQKQRPSTGELLVTTLMRFMGQPIIELTRWGFGAFIVYHISQAVIESAGKWTTIDIKAKAEGTVNYNETVTGACDAYQWPIILSVGFALACLVYARRQRTLRRNVIERQYGRIQQLESEIDPARSTSGLTARGETNPEDLR